MGFKMRGNLQRNGKPLPGYAKITLCKSGRIPPAAWGCQMLAEIGSLASIAGLLVALVGLGFALLQLSRLRGETRAARQAAEETRRLLRRDLAGTDLTRLSERIQGLMEMHRSGDRGRALDRYPEIRRLLLEIRRQHPNLTAEYRLQIQSAVNALTNMQNQVEALTGEVPHEMSVEFNLTLSRYQANLLVELEDRLQ